MLECLECQNARMPECWKMMPGMVAKRMVASLSSAGFAYIRHFVLCLWQYGHSRSYFRTNFRFCHFDILKFYCIFDYSHQVISLKYQLYFCIPNPNPNSRRTITLPLHGVAKTFKFRHRSFGVLALENQQSIVYLNLFPGLLGLYRVSIEMYIKYVNIQVKLNNCILQQVQQIYHRNFCTVQFSGPPI